MINTNLDTEVHIYFEYNMDWIVSLKSRLKP